MHNDIVHMTSRIVKEVVLSYLHNENRSNKTNIALGESQVLMGG